MAHEDKTAAPVAPTLLSRVGSAAKNVWKGINTPIGGQRRIPDPNMPAMRQLFTDPKGWAGQMGRGYAQHLKELGKPGGISAALKDVDPLSLGLIALPELTGQGVLSAISKAPEGHKAETLGDALGGILGGQLMWRTGLLGTLGGSVVGSNIGKQLMRTLTGGKKKQRKIEEQQRARQIRSRGMLPGEGISPGMIIQPGMMGLPARSSEKVGERLPEVAGTSPTLSMGGPGREDVAGKGRVANRNNAYFGTDKLRDVSGEIAAVFYAGRGSGAEGGQPYADGSIYRHLGLSPRTKKLKPNRELGDSSLDAGSSDYL